MMENPGKTWEKRGKQGGELMRFKMDFKFFLVLRDVLVDFDGFKILQFFLKPNEARKSRATIMCQAA